MISEFYVNKKKLISKQEWQQNILDIKNSVKEELTNKDDARQAIINELLRAVIERAPGQRFGILFSGGIDSSLIALLCKRAGKDFACYNLGFQDELSKKPEDAEYAELAATKLALDLRTGMLDLRQAEDLIRKTAKILGPGLNNVVNVGVGAVVIGCIEMAKKDGIKYFFSGLGSEEIFAGYQRHKLAQDKQAECWNGLLNMYERDLLRDFAIASYEKISLLTPFLDKSLIASAMKIPAALKINSSGSKLILRQAAAELRLPEEIALRGKKAAQYGSRLDRAIDKLARKNSFKYKKDYLSSLN